MCPAETHLDEETRRLDERKQSGFEEKVAQSNCATLYRNRKVLWLLHNVVRATALRLANVIFDALTTKSAVPSDGC